MSEFDPKDVPRVIVNGLREVALGPQKFDAGRAAFRLIHPAFNVMSAPLRLAKFVALSPWEAHTSRAKIEELEKRVKIDALTGLHNYAAFTEDLAAGYKPAYPERRHDDKDHTGLQNYVAMVDLDRFKSVNDAWGHGMGDEVLRNTAGVLQTHIRTGDTAYRIGGEEFAIILRDTTDSGAAAATEHLRAAIEVAKHGNPEFGFSITTSIGFSVIGENPNASLREADKALYYVKHEMNRNAVMSYGDLLREQEQAQAMVIQLPGTEARR